MVPMSLVRVPMLPDSLVAGLLLIAALAQTLLLGDLLAGHAWWGSTVPSWICLHVLSSLVATVCAARLMRVGRQAGGFLALLFGFNVLMPVAGPMAGFAALAFGAKQSRLRKRVPDHWIVTRRAELPFTTPQGRQVTRIDSRGFEEHLMYSSDNDDLYRKVLSAANIPASLSVSTFKTAMRHTDERIRLTAYNMLDRKVTELNRQIQQLERQVADGNSRQMSNTWLQIASNYWELLTLEKDEPVARKQLLSKAADAAIQAIVAMPINRNAHFLLGRVSLLQGDMRRANVAFQKARALGMPADKVMPYLAEAAFMRHDFKQVRSLLQQLDPAIRAYPPLSHVSEYWS
ncbi:hypothetical protein ACUNV4_23305 [Granulosicoccus sp. 3-233]|uniref:hypothetical protein n=1 Tax=Granulosicoccus sp. 3-233 TaxID=3417969 RepID=UPI003D33A3E1